MPQAPWHRWETPELPPKGRGSMPRTAVLYCHSQFVRAQDEGNDIDRKWGTRRTVARDYMFDRQVFLGTSRLGADLSNVGVRQTDPQWFYRILYSPQTMSPEVSMPAYRWLFRDP